MTKFLYILEILGGQTELPFVVQSQVVTGQNSKQCCVCCVLFCFCFFSPFFLPKLERKSPSHVIVLYVTVFGGTVWLARNLCCINENSLYSMNDANG